MKTITTVLILLSINFTFAQSNYEKGMTKAFELWETNKTEEASNLFERIANAEKENWLPFYYAAQIQIISSFNIKDLSILDAKLMKAQDYLNQATTWSPDNAEIIIMEALLKTSYIAFDGSKYAMTLAPKIEAFYQTAKQLEPNNPRVLLNHAEWKMGSAQFMGEDPKIYCVEVEKALLNFENDSHDVPFYPKWGKDRAQKLVADCNN